LDFRREHQLCSEHYFILSKVPLAAERERWAAIAVNERLSPLELKRSIEAGKILRSGDINQSSGQGSGINTIQGACFKLQQWERQMGGTQKIIELPAEDLRKLLQILTPTIALASAIETALSAS
jgi:hypothetical protein